MKLNPLEAFQRLIARFMLSDQARRWRDRGPGEVVKAMPPEIREGLTELKSEDIGPETHVPEYWMMGPDYERKFTLLHEEKQVGIQPPPRKKYGDYEGQ